jgi:hypothetical protein
MVKDETVQIAAVGFVVLAAVVAAIYTISKTKEDDPLKDRYLIDKGKELPVLWIYLDDSEVNSRKWTGFEERSSRAINAPFLNLCYESCVKMNGSQYRIEVISGISDLAIRLGGWEAIPTPMRNPDVFLRECDRNWIRAAVLAKWGGLWVSPSTIWLKAMGPLPKDHVVLFGSDDEVTFVGSGGTDAPSLRVAWSPAPANPIWVDWEQTVRDRLEKRSGGSDFRRDEMSDAVHAIALSKEIGQPVEVRPMAELTRKGASGRRIQVEDLLASGQDSLPFSITSEAVYVPIPWPEIKERRVFGWFLRLSEEQILESDMAVSWLFKKVLSAR